MQIETTQLLIDGQDVSTGSWDEVRDPGRLDDVVGRVAQGSAAHVDAAVQAAHRALAGWRRTPLDVRRERLMEAAALLEGEAEAMATLMARESGMLPATNRIEIGLGAGILRDNVDHAARFLQPTQFEDASSWVSVEKRPIGVVAGIVPWNAPVILTMRKLAPALVCGNTIVIKPAPTAPLGISALLRKIAALFPPGVINVVHGGRDVGHALTTHPLVRKISFTGGGPVARSIMSAAAEGLTPVQFELGGNDPAIVLDDANLADAVPKIIGGAFRRSGQFCFAVKRVYVPQSRFDECFDMMRAEVDKLRVGHPLAQGCSMGPINNKLQFDQLNSLIGRVKASGAELVELGSKIDPAEWERGYYLLPSLVRNPDADSEIVVSEQFGPLLPVVAYGSEADAVRMANQTELGLGSSVWSVDHERAVAVARELEAGMTFINQAGTSRLGQKNIPFGGVKQSGIGRESSEVGLAEYVEYHGINLHK